MQSNHDGLDDDLGDIKHTMGLAKPGHEDEYKAPIIAKLLHSLPHYNITFHRTNNTFRPTDEIYLEVNKSPYSSVILNEFSWMNHNDDD